MQKYLLYIKIEPLENIPNYGFNNVSDLSNLSVEHDFYCYRQRIRQHILLQLILKSSTFSNVSVLYVDGLIKIQLIIQLYIMWLHVLLNSRLTALLKCIQSIVVYTRSYPKFWSAVFYCYWVSRVLLLTRWSLSLHICRPNLKTYCMGRKAAFFQQAFKFTHYTRNRSHLQGKKKT